MFELLSLYAWTLPVGLCFAVLLSLLGIHLSARDRCMQSFCGSQASVVGILIALGLHIPPFFVSVPLVAAVFFLAQKVILPTSANRSTRLGTVYIVLLTASHLLSVIFPSLESHLSSIYLGDLATLSTVSAQKLLPVGLFLLSILLFFWKPLSNNSLEVALFGDVTANALHGKKYQPIIAALSLITLVLSVQFLGVLFAVAFLYLPTVILGGNSFKGFRKHALICALTAGASVLIGFLFSLYFLNLPTVPTTILVFCLLTLPVVVFKKLKLQFK